tara:strand:- start:3062 stop:3643 length:582 start_codon:yes stop_codon:yes gene_type:complete
LSLLIATNMKFDQALWAIVLNASAILAKPTTPKATDRADPDNGNFQSKCAAIVSKLSVEHGNVHFSQFVAAGTNLSLPDNDPSCAESFIVVTANICRVALSVSTSQTSGFSMEVWLPSNWTGRFLSGGNGGLNGCINYQDLAYTSALGFSAVGTNNGHNGTSGKPFLNNAGVVEDFAYRAYVLGYYDPFLVRA